jgi:HK97 family phage major capsid protein
MANDTKVLLRKATMVASDLATGGLLNPAQADRFIDMMMEDVVLSKEARIEKMKSPKALIEKIGFQSRIMVPATEATDPGAAGESNPTTSKVELSTVEGLAIVPVSYNTLEDNIERDRLSDHIVRLIAARAGVDIEEQWVAGDTGSGDSWLAQNDGLLAKISSHSAAQTGSDLAEHEDVVRAADAAFRLLPGKYLRNKRQWRYYVHPDLEFQLRQALAERSTNAGDKYLLDDAPVLVRGIPVVALPAMPTRTEDPDGDSTDQTVSDVVLVHPANVVIGIQRQIQVESERKIRERIVEYMVSIRSDMELEEEDAVAVTTSVSHAA